MGAQPVSTEKKNWGIPSEIRVAVVAQLVSTEKKNWGIPSKIRVAVVAQPVSTILGSLPNYTFGNQGCSGCSTGFNRKKKIGVYLRKSWLQWLLNRFQPFLDLSQTIPSEIRVAVVAQPVSTEKKNLGIPSKIRVAVVAQPVSTEKKKFGYTFENQGCSGCSTSFNHSWISPKLYLRKSGLQWLLNQFQLKKKIWGIPSKIMVAVVAQP